MLLGKGSGADVVWLMVVDEFHCGRVSIDT